MKVNIDPAVIRIILVVVIHILSDVFIFWLGLIIGATGGGLWIAILTTTLIVAVTIWHEFMPRSVPVLEQ